MPDRCMMSVCIYNIVYSFMLYNTCLYAIKYIFLYDIMCSFMAYDMSSCMISYMLRHICRLSLSASRAFCMNMRDASLVLHNYSSSTPRECPCNAQKIFLRRIRGLWAFCGTRCQSADYAFLRLRMHFSYLRKSLSCMPEEPLRRHG